MYYKLSQTCVTNWGRFVSSQIMANVVTDWGSFIITNWGKFSYKLGQLLQIKATVYTKQGSYQGKIHDNLEQVLQIRTIITNCSITTTTKSSSNNYYKKFVQKLPKATEFQKKLCLYFKNYLVQQYILQLCVILKANNKYSIKL